MKMEPFHPLTKKAWILEYGTRDGNNWIFLQSKKVASTALHCEAN